MYCVKIRAKLHKKIDWKNLQSHLRNEQGVKSAYLIRLQTDKSYQHTKSFLLSLSICNHKNKHFTIYLLFILPNIKKIITFEHFF